MRDKFQFGIQSSDKPQPLNLAQDILIVAYGIRQGG
jgi:hypothetical protein